MSNEVKTLTKDADGNYRVVLSRLGESHRTSGLILRPLTQGDLATLQQRVEAGLYGEFGHPEQGNKLKGDYAQKLTEINVNRIAVSIKGVYLAEAGGEQVVYGDIEPNGPYGAAVQKFIDDGVGHLHFGLRCLRHPEDDGIHATISQVVTWDIIHMGA